MLQRLPLLATSEAIGLCEVAGSSRAEVPGLLRRFSGTVSAELQQVIPQSKPDWVVTTLGGGHRGRLHFSCPYEVS